MYAREAIAPVSYSPLILENSFQACPARPYVTLIPYARSSGYRTGRLTMDDPSMMPDLSHLSAEEREIIEQVFKRQKDEEAKEEGCHIKIIVALRMYGYNILGATIPTFYWPNSTTSVFANWKQTRHMCENGPNSISGTNGHSSQRSSERTQQGDQGNGSLPQQRSTQVVRQQEANRSTEMAKTKNQAVSNRVTIEADRIRDDKRRHSTNLRGKEERKPPVDNRSLLFTENDSRTTENKRSERSVERRHSSYVPRKEYKEPYNDRYPVMQPVIPLYLSPVSMQLDC
uniref:Homeobox domain-containing protein n=1 Tax=Heterorhabditis bacteriophora TaxID=37862 RepID=A0A1I7XFZ3_HETBA